MTANWIEHRRSPDGERLGWMKPVGEGFVAIDLLGREITEAVEWLDAEVTLDELGIGYLADPFELRLDSGEWLRVRISEVSMSSIRLNKEDWGDISVPERSFTLPFPAGESLRALQR